jgi:transmembrane sensor
MTPDITQDTFNRYIAGTAAAAEAVAVRDWLTQPANQLLAQHWMQQHWEALSAHSAALPSLDEPDYDALLASLQQRLGLHPAAGPYLESAAEAPQTIPLWRRWAAAAAVASMLAGGGWLFYSQQRQAVPVELATDYGQTRLVQLPDGSQVTLNGHSTLRYAPTWANADQPREVWLDGEGYFSVQHKPNSQRFVVHTTAGLNVEVLGTKFTVYRRREQARVVLLTGKVRIDFDDRRRPDVLMKPGELVETHDAQPAVVVHKPVHTAPYAAWKDAKLELDETTIAELATRLQDTYGVEVVVETPDLNQRKMTGTVPVRDLDVLLQALEETFHLKATRHLNRITLSDKNPHKPSL